MSIRDIKNNLVARAAMIAAITSDTTTEGAIIDTADLDNGIMFGMSVSNYTDGDYTMQIFESDDDAMAGATVLANESDIGVNDITGGVYLGDTPVAQSAATAEGAEIPTVGAISNKRYLQARVVSASVTTGADVTVTATEAPELVPAA